MKKIIIEKPTDWIIDPHIGKSVTTLYNHIFFILESLSIKFETTDIFFPKSNEDRSVFYDRNPIFDNINYNYLSYHTFGKIITGLWRIKESYIPNFYTFDRSGYSGFSEFSNNQSICENIVYTKNIENYLLELKTYYSKNNISKYPQNNHINIDYKDYIFFPLQSFNDSVIKLSRLNYYNILDAITDNISYPILIKPHPFYYDKNLQKYLHGLVKKNRNIIITHCSIHSLIPNSLCCMCVNSGVGFESLLYNKPVISFGKSDYDSCTYQCKNIFEINNDMIKNCITKYYDNKIYIDKFLYYYLNEYCVNCKNKNTILNKLKNILTYENSYIQ